mmetsp:Transcript_15853/g.38899  ORF Transcript_15853/g.38899 Transcript_15853/m.38899 type:complete len:277 (-) Transcript_15853:117-947(-)|eukprot:CAMPEP_0113644046 /NCGR_PEP_ID=MMETSP0017_2-20120614/23174_1 /TAXON_ID=2856 /ORGANISM="Cylindrotheca closterium" /LENGTH=276 /DNA_ID=CAMNT_0000555621 /DNA_START=98 /DNA_END=928 /DNA_ORIENTATION=- /assembly_acc=CAM_ASM_000147
MPQVQLPHAEFKVVMLGDTFTGKTSLVMRFAEGYYREGSRNATVGASFIMKRLTVRGVTSKIQIWDTSGQDQFKRLASMYYKQAAAAIICYDISSPETFEAVRSWIDELQSNATSRIVIGICATKSDLVRNADTSEVEQLAEQTGAIFFNTSAKDNTNVHLLFEKIAERVLEIQQEYPEAINVNLVKVEETNLSPRQTTKQTMQATGTPGKNTYNMANYMPDTPYIDEKKDTDDHIIDQSAAKNGGKKGQSNGTCGDTYLCGDLPEEMVQNNCTIS